jgi:hypothetical protein
VTSLQLHPNLPTLLLSASTDGLINIFDVSKPDEEEALYQVINHRSAVAHAGFMYPSTDIYALGTDETLSFYGLQSQAEEAPEPTPKAYGDVREQFGCEYLAKLHWVGSEAYIAAGKHRYVQTYVRLDRGGRELTSHSTSALTLFPVKKSGAGPLDYICDPENTLSFPGAHSEEIVRDLFTDVHVCALTTIVDGMCGMDTDLYRMALPTHAEKMGSSEPGRCSKAVWEAETRSKNRKEKQRAKSPNERRNRRSERGTRMGRRPDSRRTD